MAEAQRIVPRRVSCARVVAIVAILATGLVALPGGSTVAAATPNTLDTGFGTAGVATTPLPDDQSVTDLLVQPDGKIVVVGPTEVAPEDDDFLVARYLPNGQPDTSFGSGGRTVTKFSSSTDLPQAVGRQPDGKIVAAGFAHASESVAHFAVARYNVDGSPDLTFGSLGKRFVDVTTTGNELAHSLVVQPNGKIVLAGVANYSGGTAGDFAFARLNADGSLDTTFGGTGTVVHSASPRQDVIADVTIAPDGDLVGTGFRDAAATGAVDADFAVIRLHAADGSLDETFSDDGVATMSPAGGITEIAQDVVVQPDGKIVVVGPTATVGDSSGVVVRFTERGALDRSFGNDGVALSDTDGGNDRSFFEVALDSSGHIVAAGHESWQPEAGQNEARFLVQRFNYDGTTDEQFGAVTGEYGETAGALAIQPDGKIVVGGGAKGGSTGFDLVVARYLGSPPAPVRSSGSGRIAYTHSAGNGDVYVAGLDGSDPRPLVTGPSTDSDPSLSPDGSRVVFVSDRAPAAGGRDLFLADTSGTGAITSFAPSGAWDADPEWSPDGSRIAFTSDRSGTFDIWVDNPDDDADPINLTGGNGRHEGFPTWSPDGQTIAFRSSVTGGTEDIYVVPAAGGAATALTEDPATDTAPSWSPDGSRIAFASNRAGTAGLDIFVMNADGSGETRLTTATGNDTFPEWTADGASLVFEGIRSGTARLVSRSVTSGAETVLTGCLANSCTPSTIANLSLVVAPPPVILTGEHFFAGDFDQYVLAPAAATGPHQVPSTPTRVPLAHVPLQPSAPDIVNSAPIGLLDITTSPIGLLDITTSPIGLLDITTSPIGLLDITTSPIGLLDITTSPLASEALGRILLSQVPLRSPNTWEALLGRPVVAQSETLLAALQELRAKTPPVPLTLGALAGTGPMADVSVHSLLLGDTPLSALPQPSSGPSWCERIANLGYDNCGRALVSTSAVPANATAASALQLQLAGVPFNGQGDRALPLQLVQLGRIESAARAAAPFQDLKLGAFANIGGSRLGTLELSTVTNANDLFVCGSGAGSVDCTTATLADAAAAGAIRPATTFRQLPDVTGNLLLGELVGAIVPAHDTPAGGLDLDDLNIYGYRGAGTSTVEFEASYRAIGTSAINPLLHVDLPESFFIETSSPRYWIGGAYVGSITPSLSGHRATFTIPGVVPAGQEVVVRYTTRPGVRLTTATSDLSVVASGIHQSLTGAAAVEVTPNFEPDDYQVNGAAVAGGTALQPGELLLSHVQPGDRDYFTFPAPPVGTKIDIAIGNVTFDVDAVLYEVLEGGREALRSNATGRVGAADLIVPVPDDGADLTNSGEPLTAEIREDISFENLPVAAVSANRGAAAEQLSAVVTPDAKAYVLQVSGYLGAAGDLPVTVHMRHTAPAPLPACAARTWASATVGDFPAPMTSLPAGTTSLVLLNGDRLIDRYGTAPVKTLPEQTAATAEEAIAAVESMEDEANEPEGVEVEVLRLDAIPSVRAAYAAFDDASSEAPCNPERANDVVRAINDAVDGLLANSPGVTLEHLTIVGDDEIIPFARIPDLTVGANESGFGGDLAFLDENTALRAAYAGGYLPSDDPFGDLRPSPYLGRWLYVTDFALGRVVETPAEIAAAVLQFIASGGQLNPDSAVTTAYDFMKKTGEVIDGHAEKQLGAPQGDLLTDTWTKTNVADVFSSRPGGAAGITSLNAHFDHYRAEPANAGPGMFTAGDVAAGNDLTGRIIHTMGCHSGTSLPDIAIGDPSLDLTQVRDWAQTLAAKGAPSYVGQTGYGLGLNGLVELSSRILADYAKNLSSAASTGGALAAAKRAYADRLVGDDGAPTTNFFGVYDEKALVEATYFGIPMYRVSGLAAVPPPAPTPTSEVSLPTAPTAHIGGIQAADVVITPTVTETTTGQGAQLSWRGNSLTTADRPILPLVEFNAPPKLHGALITELSSTDRANFNPDFANVKVDSATTELDRETGDVVFPAAPHGVTRSKVLFVPSQFRTTDAKAGTGTLRQYTRAKVKLLTSDSNDFVKPRITSVLGVRKTTDRIDFTVQATDLQPTASGATQPGTVVQVVVPVFDESGTWKFAHLSRDAATGEWRGSVNVVGRRAQYGVQAVDAAGNVGLSFNKGDLFDVIIPKPENPYRMEGFFSPVKNGILNGVQAGRTVPIKWRLYDKNGIVRNLLVVEVIDTEQIACDNRQVHELSLLNLPLSALTYDVVDDQYSYGFNTQKDWARTCRRLNIRLNDRTVHSVDFAFRG